MYRNLDGILTKGRGEVFSDAASDSLIITDTGPGVDVADFARSLDVETPQIAVQAGRLRQPDHLDSSA